MSRRISGFHAVAGPLVDQVLATHHLTVRRSEHGQGRQAYRRYDFEYNGVTHRIELADDSPWMYVGRRVFECFLAREWRSGQVLARSFASRLDNYLSGGSWDDDPGVNQDEPPSS